MRDSLGPHRSSDSVSARRIHHPTIFVSSSPSHPPPLLSDLSLPLLLLLAALLYIPSSHAPFVFCSELRLLDILFAYSSICSAFTYNLSIYSISVLRAPVTIMADALCGPSNALQNLQKHTSVDRTLQQDRLTSRQSPSQVSIFGTPWSCCVDSQTANSS